MNRLTIWSASAFLVMASASRVLAQGFDMKKAQEVHAPTAMGMMTEVSNWIATHPGVSFAVGASVISVVASIVYNRYYPSE